jgi:Xaa-Pro aminopeptidase
MSATLITMLAAHRAPAADVDVTRLRRERHARLQAELARRDIEAAVLLHGANVGYATGLPTRAVDMAHASFERPVAVVVAGEDRPHLLWDGGGAVVGPGGDGGGGLDGLAVERHPAVWPELDEGAERLRAVLADLVGDLAGRRIAVDVQTGAMLRAGVLDGADLVDAAPPMGAAKLTKTADELACIAEAQRRNEVAMVPAQRALRPGATRSAVAGAFLAGLREVGVEACMIDPIFQPMPRSVAEGPRTTTGDVAFPTGVGDPVFAEGDLVWVDAGVDHLGYASDFGRTWIVGRDPDPAERRLFARWCDVMTAVLDVVGPGVTAGALGRAATEAGGVLGTGTAGGRPWLPHFYLGHGVGVESAEMPFVGTDLGTEFDDAFVLAPGMVLVLEPVAWEDGTGGYRSEEIIAVTDDGWRHLGGGHGYEPFAA